MTIAIATAGDIPGLETLINSAYRGETSKTGWTSEAHFIKGDRRTNAQTLRHLMEVDGTVFLKSINGNGEIEGCVLLQKQKDNRLYLGMLSVKPLLQAKGTGKKLMEAAAQYAKQQRCSSIYMRVISRRHELIEWYVKQGFLKTGQREPFPDDPRFGVPDQPLEFEILEKKLPLQTA